MTEISAGLLMPIDVSGSHFGRHFMSLLSTCSPGLVPMRCGNTEPLESSAGLAAEQIVERFWSDPFLWSAKTRGLSGLFSLSPTRSHCGPFIYGKVQMDAIDELRALFDEMARVYPIDFGWIHLLGDPEWTAVGNRDARRLLMPFNSGITPHELSTGIPNLAWLTILGEPYLSVIDSEEVRKHAARVWTANPLASEPQFVQITDSPFDVIDDYEEFETRRGRVRDAIGSSLFKTRGCNAEHIPVLRQRDTTARPATDGNGHDLG